MKRVLNRGGVTRLVRHKPNKPRIRIRYTSKAYRLLDDQLTTIRLGQLGNVVSDMLHDTMHRPGFMRHLVDPEGARKMREEANRAKAERDKERGKRKAECLAMYRKYFIPYQRNKLTYPLVPDHVMESLGFRKIVKHDNTFLNSILKTGWQ